EQVLLAEDHAWMESSSDSDQEINANMVFMVQTEKVLFNSEASSSSADNTISENPPYKYKWANKDVPVTEGSSKTTTERYMKNYKNVSQDIHNQLNAEAETVQIILTGIDNDIYSTVDTCPNACEMWKAIERYMKNYKNVSQDIHNQLNAEAETVQINLTGIDNDIYSTVDTCPNACEMWKAIERLKQG
nr:hypothetical protein [Tanacetum cinerariifolium]